MSRSVKYSQSLNTTSEMGNAHPIPRGQLRAATKQIKDAYFLKCMLNGPTRNLNPIARAKVLAARKAAGL